MLYLRGVVGLVVLLLLAWAISAHRRRPPWRVIAGGIGLQLLLAGLILGTGCGRVVFQGLADFVQKLISMALPGATFVFGDLGDPEGPFGFILAFAGTGLVVILFFAALLAILYHIGLMQLIIWCLARVMSITMGLSGAESMAGAANIFVGMTEAPLIVRPYIPTMTMSELNALMTGGFATIAGTVLAVYIGMLGEEFAAHLLTASVMSAPAAFVFAKIIRPEVQEPETGRRMPFRVERSAHNVLEAATNGVQDGLKLYLNIIAMLIAFIALIELIDWPLGEIGRAVGMDQPLDLARIFGWILAPLAWCMGVEGWHDCQLFGSLLGTKIAVNELVAFKQMTESLGAAPGEPGAFEHARTATMAAYALCGFSNFASIGIQLGGITPLAPERKADLSKLAFRAMIGGTLASATTATIAGMFLV